MIRCRPSVSVSRPASPIRGPDLVAERLGRDHQRVDRRQRAPLAGQRPGVALGRAHDDLAPAPRPAVVSTRHGPDRASPASARGCVTPRRSTARARPRTSRAGCTAAQCGVYVAPRTRGARAAVGWPRRRPAARRSSGPTPHARASSTSARSRRSWTRCAPASSVPPCCQCASMPSAATTRPTSPTVSRIAAQHPDGGVAAGAAADAGPRRRAIRAAEAGNSAEHQPPLRPEAPKPGHLALEHHDAQRRARPRAR